jgi:hypothetical protein
VSDRGAVDAIKTIRVPSSPHVGSHSFAPPDDLVGQRPFLNSVRFSADPPAEKVPEPRVKAAGRSQCTIILRRTLPSPPVDQSASTQGAPLFVAKCRRFGLSSAGEFRLLTHLWVVETGGWDVDVVLATIFSAGRMRRSGGVTICEADGSNVVRRSRLCAPGTQSNE